LGEWVFEDVPLDAAVTPGVYGYDTVNSPDELRSLVPAQARVLTVEEAESPPAVERGGDID